MSTTFLQPSQKKKKNIFTIISQQILCGNVFFMDKKVILVVGSV